MNLYTRGRPKTKWICTRENARKRNEPVYAKTLENVVNLYTLGRSKTQRICTCEDARKRNKSVHHSKTFPDTRRHWPSYGLQQKVRCIHKNIANEMRATWCPFTENFARFSTGQTFYNFPCKVCKARCIFRRTKCAYWKNIYVGKTRLEDSTSTTNPNSFNTARK